MKLKIEYGKISWILVAILIVTLSISLLELYDYSDSLKIEISKRDNLIESLNKRDSILQESMSVVDSVRDGSSNINISELIKYANSLTDEISELYKKVNLLNDSVCYYKIYYDLSQSYFNHKYIVTPNAAGGKNYSMDQNAVKKDEYEKCQAKYYNSEKEVRRLRNELDKHKRALKWYGIHLERKSKDDGIVFPSPYYAPKIDSAFILLEVYRDKLKYNKESKTWKVGNRSTFTISTFTSTTVDTIVFRNPKP